METQPELVVAAEAVRTWVRSQRASWTTPVRQMPPAHEAPPAARGPVVTFTPLPAATVPPAPTSFPIASATPDPLPVLTLAGVPAAASLPAASVFEPASGAVDRTDADVSLESPPERRARGGLAYVAAAVVLAVIVGGGVLTRSRWRGLGTAPTVGTAAFTSLPAGAQVLVDGHPVGNTPVQVELAPGSHAVELRLKSATRTQQVQIVRGRETAVDVDWNARRFGALQVSSTPTGAKVLVDGRERGRTPLVLDDILVGGHTVQIESSDGSVRRRVEIADGKTETLAESIYPGWLQVSVPIDVTVVDGKTAVQIDDRNRVLLKAGPHTVHIENRELAFAETRQVDIEPGGTSTVVLDVPPSTLTVTGSTGADVFVDGTKAGETPLTDFQVKLGRHDIMVVDKAGATRHATVTVTTAPAQLEIAFAKP